MFSLFHSVMVPFWYNPFVLFFFLQFTFEDHLCRTGEIPPVTRCCLHFKESQCMILNYNTAVKLAMKII